GLARSLQAFGQVLTPVAGASLIGHRPRMLRISLIAGALMRLQILFVALSGLFLGASDIGIFAIVLFMMLMGFFQGMQGVMLNSLRAKVIPVNRRGFVSGWRNFLAGATTASLSYFAGGYFIDNNLLGDGYASLFLLAFVITSMGLIALAFTKEPASAAVRSRENVKQSFQAVLPLLRDNPAFARFFLVGALGSFGRMAMPFYIIYAGTQMDITGAMLGVLTTIWMLTGTATNLVWGSIADRSGYRIVMIMTLGLWVLAHIQLLLAGGVLGILVFFVMIGTASGGFNQARQNMVLELGTDTDIPLRVAISNMAVNTIGTVGPFLGGVIASFMGHAAIFLLCLIMQLIALVIMIVWIPEPRRIGAHVTIEEDD
ncbi:MAG: MFS transporter, partial [Pseudomonadales bacterium]